MNDRVPEPKAPPEDNAAPFRSFCSSTIDRIVEIAESPALDPDTLVENSMNRFSRWIHELPYFLVPSFLQHWNKPEQPEKLHAIAALDGLRGWACLLVFNFHFLFTYTWKTAIGWGFNEENWGLHQLPIIHMLISGHVMVAIFFVISGYVLSYKPLKLVRAHSWDQAFRTLASSTFRRGFRLYVPSLVGLFTVLVAVRLGFYNYSVKVVTEGHTIVGTNEQHPTIYPTLFGQLRDWFLTVVWLMDPWDWALYYNFYNPHLWTIPVEFRSSMLLFLTILATSRLRTPVRFSLVFCLIFFCSRWGRWDVILFMSGMILAEVDIIYKIWERPAQPTFEPGSSQQANHHDLEKSQPLPSRKRDSRQKLWLWIFLVGLWLGSSPNSAPAHTPGYRLISKFIPRTYGEGHRLPQTLGAVIIVCSINHSNDLQKLFTNRLAQYLGKISYAFYIVHGPILHTLGYSLMPNIWKITGQETNTQYCLGFLIGWLICLPISIWAGDVFWRAVDIPSVRLARRIEEKFSASAV